MPARHRHRRPARRRLPLRITYVAGLAAAVLLTALAIDSRAQHHAKHARRAANATRAADATRSVTAPARHELRRTATHASSDATSATLANPLTAPATRAVIDGRSGDISVGVEDLTSGQEWYWNPNSRFQTASIIKVDILETLLHDAMLNHAPLDADDTDLAQQMIEASSDTAATSLWDEAGGSSGIGAFNARAGLTQTSPNPDGYWGETMTSVSDQLLILRQLVEPDSLLDAGSRDYELGLMENIDAGQNWGVSAGVPSNVTLALKNGWVPITSDSDWEINSIGWIDGDGRNYLIAVLTSGDPSEGYGITTIEDIAARVWSALAPAG